MHWLKNVIFFACADQDALAHKSRGSFCSVRRTYERSCTCDHKPVAQVCQNPKDDYQVLRKTHTVSFLYAFLPYAIDAL